MNLWAVTMVKDEIDILEHTLTHLATEGVDTILVADNMSTDGTWDLISSLDVGCELRCNRDPDPAYYQSRKMTLLARQAFTGGADWVIPFDADELWYSRAGTLRHAIQRRHSANVILATLYNYFPTSADDETEPNPFLRIRSRSPEPSELHKVVVRRGAVAIAQGNHDADGPAPFIKANSTIEVAHFPWRGWKRFKRKIENGYAAYQATDLPEHIGTHWRQYGRLLEQHGETALRDAYETWFVDPEAELEVVPAPWQRHRIGTEPS